MSKKNPVFQKIKEYVSLVKQAKIPVSKTYLFGSHAKGGATPDSDIDVCIISPKFGKDYFDEQLARIRDIRSSERRFYQKITDI